MLRDISAKQHHKPQKRSSLSLRSRDELLTLDVVCLTEATSKPTGKARVVSVARAAFRDGLPSGVHVLTAVAHAVLNTLEERQPKVKEEARRATIHDVAKLLKRSKP